MRSTCSLPYLCALLMLTAGSCFAQFGYVTQAPAAGAAVSNTASSLLNPNYAATNTGYGGPVAYGGQPAGGNNGYMGGMQQASGSASPLLTYGQLEAEYVYTSFKDKSLDASHGLGIGLMAQLFNPLFVHATYNWSSSDSTSLTKGYDFSTVTIGGGAYFQITPQIHLVGEVGGLYSSLSASKDSLSFNDGALYIRPTLRIAACDSIELDLGVMMTSADNYNARVLELGGFYRLFSSMDLGLGADFGDQDNTYHLGVRFRW